MGLVFPESAPALLQSSSWEARRLGWPIPGVPLRYIRQSPDFYAARLRRLRAHILGRHIKKRVKRISATVPETSIARHFEVLDLRKWGKGLDNERLR